MKLFEFIPILLNLYNRLEGKYINTLLNIYDSNMNNKKISNRHFINYRLAISLRDQ